MLLRLTASKSGVASEGAVAREASWLRRTSYALG